jgi:hypothetical protein
MIEMNGKILFPKSQKRELVKNEPETAQMSANSNKRDTRVFFQSWLYKN